MAKVTITIEDKEGPDGKISITVHFEPRPIMEADKLTSAQVMGMSLLMKSKEIAEELR